MPEIDHRGAMFRRRPGAQLAAGVEPYPQSGSAGRETLIRIPRPLCQQCRPEVATKLVYATGMDDPEKPTGVNRRLCERENCGQRAEPPITRTVILDQNRRR